MIESSLFTNKSAGKERPNYRRLASMSRISNGIINELSNPVDAANRFINLALASTDENSQARQFLLESKQGIKKISHLLTKLDNYVKKMEKELRRP